MNRRTKRIVINAGIAAGLIVEVYRGAGLPAVLFGGVFLFILANLLMKWKEDKDTG